MIRCNRIAAVLHTSRTGFAGLIAAFVLLLGHATTAPAQGPDDINEGTRLELDAQNNIYRFTWWGRSGSHYFIQHSEDLAAWTYLPLIIPGADAIEEWGFANGPQKFFVRLRYWTGPVTDPQTDDFDGDGLGNWEELLLGTDPFKKDSDGDGMPDGWENGLGLDPANSDPGLDSDGDGLSNLTEYLSGTDPLAAATDSNPEFLATGLKLFTPTE